MSLRRAAESRAEAAKTNRPAVPAQAEVRPPADAPAPPPQTTPRSIEEAEARYIACRDAWTAAMRAANSGRPADLASLAIAQGAFEEATAELQAWRSGSKVAIPIQPERNTAGLQAAINQEIAWRRMHEPKPTQGGALSRLVRKVTRRG